MLNSVKFYVMPGRKSKCNTLDFAAQPGMFFLFERFDAADQFGKLAGNLTLSRAVVRL